MKIPVKQVYTTGEVAKICTVSLRTVCKWFDSGRIRGYRIPGSKDRRIPRQALLAFLRVNDMPQAADIDAEALHQLLLVGVDDLTADVLREAMPEDLGYRHLRARSWFEAGMLLGNRDLVPEVIVVDHALGRRACLEAIAMARRGFEPGCAPWLVAIACEDDHQPSELKAAGYDEVYLRPFDAAELAEKLKAAWKRAGT